MSTILLIEDDELLAECYVRWLTAAGHKTRHAMGAQDAFDAIDEQVPDVIMLDMLLHGANGMQFLYILRSHADLSAIPILLCSSALPDPTPDMRAYGVRAALDKATVTRAILCDAIARLQ